MFLPLRDQNPTHGTPWVTWSLVAANILLFLVELGQGAQAADFLARWGATPFELTRGQDLVGAVPGTPLVHMPGPSPLWITAFTSMFLHGGWLHLGGNMLFLWIFGNNVEEALGHLRFALFYLAGGLAGLALHVGVDPASIVPTVGASGAISAVLGAYWVLFPRARVNTLLFLGIFITVVELRAGLLIGLWVALQFLGGLSGLTASFAGGGVAYWAHVGGFVLGWAAIRHLVPKDWPLRRLGGRWRRRATPR